MGPVWPQSKKPPHHAGGFFRSPAWARAGASGAMHDTVMGIGTGAQGAQGAPGAVLAVGAKGVKA